MQQHGACTYMWLSWHIDNRDCMTMTIMSHLWSPSWRFVNVGSDCGHDYIRHALDCDEQIAVSTHRNCCSSGKPWKDKIIDNWQWRQIKTCKTKQRSVSGNVCIVLIPHVDLNAWIDDNGIYWQVKVSHTACVACTADLQTALSGGGISFCS